MKLLLLLLITLSLTSCTGLYGPNPQPPGIKGASDVQPVYFGDDYEPGMHECHE